MRCVRIAAMFGMILFITGCPIAPTTGDNTGNGDATTGDGTGMTDNDTGGTTTGDAANGKTLFETNCMVCHAVDASGGIGPNIQGEDFDDIRLHPVEGHDGHPTFDLTDDDVRDIEAHLATLVP